MKAGCPAIRSPSHGLAHQLTGWGAIWSRDKGQAGYTLLQHAGLRGTICRVSLAPDRNQKAGGEEERKATLWLILMQHYLPEAQAMLTIQDREWFIYETPTGVFFTRHRRGEQSPQREDGDAAFTSDLLMFAVVAEENLMNYQDGWGHA